MMMITPYFAQISSFLFKHVVKNKFSTASSKISVIIGQRNLTQQYFILDIINSFYFEYVTKCLKTKRQNYRLSNFPFPLFPVYKCLGFKSKMCRSPSPFRASFAIPFSCAFAFCFCNMFFICRKKKFEFC